MRGHYVIAIKNHFDSPLARKQNFGISSGPVIALRTYATFNTVFSRSLPGPNSKKTPPSGTNLEKTKNKLKVKHVRGASSVTSLKQVVKMAAELPSKKKPESNEYVNILSRL